MDNFLVLLTVAMTSINNCRGSAVLAHKKIEKAKVKIMMRDDKNKGKRFINEKITLRKCKITKRERHEVIYSTLFNYKIMRIRAKISFIAFQKKCTFLELMLNQILKSYKELYFDKNNKEHQQEALAIKTQYDEITGVKAAAGLKSVMQMLVTKNLQDCTDENVIRMHQESAIKALFSMKI